MIELEFLEKLNLSHNNLSNLLHYLSGPAKLLRESLETLILVNVDWHASPDFNSWLLESLSLMPGLYELDVSENHKVLVDKLLLSM